MRIAVMGGTGLIGAKVVVALVDQGHEVIRFEDWLSLNSVSS